MLRQPSSTPRCLAAFLWTALLIFHGSSAVELGETLCLDVDDQYDSLQVIDSDSDTIDPVCTKLGEAKVRLSVPPVPEPENIGSLSISWTQIYWGLVCNGSIQVSENFSTDLLEGGDRDVTIGYRLTEALAVGDTCFFYGCYRHIVQYFVNAKKRTDIFISGLNATSCVMDLDECAQGIDRCEQDCIDIRSGTPNSYRCKCRKGYRLLEDFHGCTDVDECETEENNCDDICTTNSSSGWFNCSCEDGFSLDEDGHTCNDINECEGEGEEGRNGTVLCETETTGQECNNTYGDYDCICPRGFYFDTTTNNCTEIDWCAQEGNTLCQHDCTNQLEGYICKCRTQWYIPDGLYNCTVIDVCTKEAVSCGSHSSCVNSPDSVAGHVCVCDSGYSQHMGQNNCSSNEIVHVYWIVPVGILLILIIFIGGCVFLRHKYIQYKNDAENKYKALFRYSGRGEKLDPTHEPVDLRPLKKIPYTFSLTSTLELLGYHSHASLHEACANDEKEKELENTLQIREEEERVRRGLSAIIEVRESSVSSGDVSGANSPTQTVKFIHPDVPTSGYIEENQIVKSGQFNILEPLPETQDDEWDAGDHEREEHIQSTSNATPSDQGTCTTNRGYINEQMPGGGNITFTLTGRYQSPSELDRESVEGDDTDESDKEGVIIFRTLGNNCRQQEQEENASDPKTTREVSKERYGSPSPSEYSADTVFSMNMPPPTTRQQRSFQAYVNDMDVSEYGLEIDSTSELKLCPPSLSLKTESSEVSAKPFTNSYGRGFPMESKGRSRTTLSSGYVSESGASEYTHSSSSGHHPHNQQVLPQTKPTHHPPPHPPSSGSYLEDSVFGEDHSTHCSEYVESQHLPLYPPPSITTEGDDPNSGERDIEASDGGFYPLTLGENRITLDAASPSKTSTEYSIQDRSNNENATTSVSVDTYVNSLRNYELERIEAFEENPVTTNITSQYYANSIPREASTESNNSDYRNHGDDKEVDFYPPMYCYSRQQMETPPQQYANLIG